MTVIGNGVGRLTSSPIPQAKILFIPYVSADCSRVIKDLFTSGKFLNNHQKTWFRRE